MKPNFTVALIARNEEKTLPRLLNSLREFKSQGGEIILLDTGSTDNTAKVAQDLGCIVYPVKDKFVKTIDNASDINSRFITNNEKELIKDKDKLFDFASARNYIAALSSTDVVCMPDCDEIFTRFDIQKICKAIDEGATQLEYNFVYSHDEYGNEAIKFMHSKFYNTQKMRWQGIIHEVLVGESNRVFLDEDIIKLEHYQNPETNRGGYLKGLALDCYLHPDNDRNSHYLAREMMYTGRYYSAIKEFERHVTLGGWVAERAQSYTFIGDCYLYLSNMQKAFENYNKAIFLDTTRREPFIKLARLYKYLNNPSMTAVYTSACMQIPWSPFYANDYSHYSTEPHELMYWAKGWLGDIVSAKEHLMKAFKFKPGNPIYLRDINIYYGLPFISIIVPQLGREEGLRKLLDSIEALDYPKELIQTIIIDGPGTVPNKVKEGVKKSYGEYIVYAANDMTFTPGCIKTAIQEGRRDNKRLIAFDTGVRNTEGFICEHFIIKKDLIPLIGNEIFDTDFVHSGCDNLLWHKCTKLNESMISTGFIIHNHFSRIGSGIEPDEINKIAYKFVEQDRELLKLKLEELNKV